MKKRLITFLLDVAMLLTLAACGEPKIIHCDRCGKEISVGADSDVDEDWVIMCGDCEEELYGDEPLFDIK